MAAVREGFLGRDRIAFAMSERVDFESSVGRRQMEALGREVRKHKITLDWMT